MLHPFLVQLGVILLKIVCLLVAIAYYTIAERKIMAAIQRRRGPNVVGFWGLLQPLADGLKLIAKEMVIPSHSNSRIFVIAPLCVLTLSLISWSVLPFGCFDYTELSTNGAIIETLYSGNFPWLRSKWAYLDNHELYTALDNAEFFSESNAVPPHIVALYKADLPQVRAEVAYREALAAASGRPVPLGPRAHLIIDGLGFLSVLTSVGVGTAYLMKHFRKGDGKSTLSFDLLTEINAISDVRYGLLVILALSSLSVYGLIIAGWSSSSKYAFLGALRSAAQMISYEVSISLVIIPVIFMSGSLNFTEIVMAQTETVNFVAPLLPLAIIFFISMIAETNRTPFDLPEAEAELVAGYNVEYSSIIFAMFFLAEYGNMILMSIIKSELFLGGWTGVAYLPAALVVSVKALLFCFAFVLVRATFPRYRYDQLMDIGWKIFLPISTGLLILVIGIIMGYHAVPVVAELHFVGYNEPHLS